MTEEILKVEHLDKFYDDRQVLELYNFMCKDEQFLKLNSNWV